MMMIKLEEVPLSSASASAPFALALSPTYGFPVDSQPHPWNAPGPAASPIECDAEALNRLARGTARRGGSSVLSMRHPPGGWSRDGMNALGWIALTALREEDTVVRFFLRATPAELLADGVLPSLSLLELERLEVLAGATSAEPAHQDSHDSSMALLDSEVLERSCLEVARNGLAPVSRIVVVLGLPFETTEEVVEKVQVATRIAVASAIRRLRFEWWRNVPGSPLHRAGPSRLEGGDRAAVREATEVIRLLYDDLEIECLEDLD